MGAENFRDFDQIGPNRRNDDDPVPGADQRLEPIRTKVLAGRRLSLDEGAVLYDTSP